MKRFVLHVGWVYSMHDGQRHWIGAPALAELYGVRLDECIIYDIERPQTYQGLRDLDRYLHLHTQYGIYLRVTELERSLYPIERPQCKPEPEAQTRSRLTRLRHRLATSPKLRPQSSWCSRWKLGRSPTSN